MNGSPSLVEISKSFKMLVPKGAPKPPQLKNRHFYDPDVGAQNAPVPPQLKRRH